MTGKPITPWPAPTGEMNIGGGQLEAGRFSVSGPGGLANAVRLALGPLTDYRGGIRAVPVEVRLDESQPPEGFRLSIDGTGAVIRARDTAGAGYGAFALRGLLPAEAWRAAGQGTWLLPYATIEDSPAFSWRSMHLDVARHFLPKSDVLRFIDLMYAHRLNRLHFHLTDDQGWRIGLEQYPRLTEIAATRTETFVGNEFRTDAGGSCGDGTPHGGYYTGAELREIVAYAAERSIVVVPEVNLPGHSTALLSAIPELRVPELARHDDLFSGPSTHWGVHRNLISPLPEAFVVLEQLLGAVCEVIDSPYLHVGGDECELDSWRDSAAVARYQAEHSLWTMGELRADVDRRLCEIVSRLGRRPLVWDEAWISQGLPRDAIVTIWRSRHLIEPVTAAGYDCVLAPASKTYIDHPESNGQDEPLSIGGMLPSSTIAAWAPRLDADSPHVLGVQGQLWSEYLPSRRALEYAAFPRLSILAAAGWTGEETALDDAFGDQLDRLSAMGVEYRPPSGPHPWQRGGTGIRAAADPDIPLPCDMDLWRLLPWINQEDGE